MSRVRTIALHSAALLLLVAPLFSGGVATTFAQGNPGIGGDSGSGNPGIGGDSGDPQSGQGETLVNPLKVDSLEELLQIVLAAVVRIGVIVLTVMLVWTGFLFIKARGKPEEITKAKQALLWTIIGGFILLAAEAIGMVIKSTAETL